MTSPLVSIIITTKNEEKHIPNLLASIRKQTYKAIETVVVDNNSTDNTQSIAKSSGVSVFEKGPERSAQRNFGAQKARGVYLLFLDADMELTPQVVEECVTLANKSKLCGAVIPEKSFGMGFWAKCKALERSFYLGVPWIESARFYQKKVFQDLGGYDEALTGPEDFELSQRCKQQFGERSIGRISSLILHNEGKLSLWGSLKKKYYYGKKMSQYQKKESAKGYFDKQANIFTRYGLFFQKKRIILDNPIVFMGMLSMKALEMGAILLGKLFSGGE